MRKVLLSLTMIFLACALYAQTSKIVYVSTPGSLSTLLTANELSIISDLTVYGMIDSTDFVAISGMSSLSHLDLSDVVVSEGRVPEYAFVEKTSLAKVELPLQLSAIGAYSFLACSNLKTITIPGSCASIGSSAFMNCSGLTAVYVFASKPIDLSASQGVFDGVDSATGKFIVPVGSESLYQAGYQWSSHTITSDKSLAVVSSESKVIGNGATVQFQMEALNVSSYKWEFPGGSPSTSNSPSPLVQYSAPGIYAVTLSYAGTDGDSVITKTDYVTVMGIAQNDTTICSGKYIMLDLVGAEYLNSITWSTGMTASSSLELMVYSDTVISVKMVKGLFQFNDTIHVYVPKTASLPSTQQKCDGDTVELFPGTFVSYSWSDQSTQSKLLATKTGFYSVTVTDQFNCTSNAGVEVFFQTLPVVNLGEDTTMCPGKIKILKADSSATYSWSTGETKQMISVNATGDYSVTVSDAYGCTNSDTVQVTIIEPFVEQIGAVLTDEATGSNMVVWAKTMGKDVDHYEIARESGTLGVFETVGSKSSTETSAFTDETADSHTKSYRYKLLTYDYTCGIATPGDVHKSMFLQAVTTTDNGIGLMWNAYEGINVSSYKIMKRQTGGEWAVIDSVSGSTSSLSYTDYSQPLQGVQYMVEFELPQVIDVSAILMKSDSGPFSIATSNIVEVEITANPIQIIKRIADTTISLDKLSPKYLFADYFSSADTTVTYTVHSSNEAVLRPVDGGSWCSFVLNGAGEAMMIVTASTTSGQTAMLEFMVMVPPTSQTTVNCGDNMTVSSEITQVSCHGEYTGAVSISVTGGAEPYSYKWSNARTDNKITNVPAGTYSVIVTDSLLCSTVRTFDVTEPAAALTIAASEVSPQCNTSDGTITVSVSQGISPYSYVWDDGSTGTSVMNKPSGNYSVTVTDAAGCKLPYTFALNDNGAPAIVVDTITSTTCHPDDGTILLTTTGATSYAWSDGGTIEDRAGLAAGSYALTVMDGNGCKSVISAVVPAAGITQPEIALVSVSEETGRNIIVWEKETSEAIDFYTIYREVNKSGNYAPLAKVSSGSRSLFVDATADADDQSWRYRLSATGYCGNETPMSSALGEFKTINLTVSKTDAGMVLSWDAYEGSDYFKYVICRKYADGRIERLDSVSANVKGYVDTDIDSNVVGYFVATDLPTVFDPFGMLKSDSGPYSQSLSNIAENELLETSLTAALVSIRAYPVPVHDNLIVDVDGATRCNLKLINFIGQVVYSQAGQGEIIIDCSQLKPGVYVLSVESDKDVKKQMIVVE